jgi:hypothetical protein
LGFNAVFQKNIPPQSSGLENETSKKAAKASGKLLSFLPASAGFLFVLFFSPEY